MAIRNLGISEHVRFQGWITGDQLEKEFLNASIFCLPSYKEGVPMAILEAMAYGIPVVTTLVGGIPDLMRSEENGILTPVADVNSLVENLLRLIRSVSL